MGSKRKGLTMIELITAVVIMGIIAGMSSISLTSSKQSFPKREAERIAAYLMKLTEKASRMKINFKATLSAERLAIQWIGANSNESLTLDPDLEYAMYVGSDFLICTLSSLSGSYTSGGNTYEYKYHLAPHRYISVTPKEGASHYIVITEQDIVK